MRRTDNLRRVRLDVRFQRFMSECFQILRNQLQMRPAFTEIANDTLDNYISAYYIHFLLLFFFIFLLLFLLDNDRAPQVLRQREEC